MSLVVREPVFVIPTRSETNRAVQLHKMTRGLKFCMQEEEGLYYPCGENKCADQLRRSWAVTAELICVFVFAYVKSRFSHDAAHII